MAKKKKNYNLLLYELQQEAVRNAAITGSKVSNSALEKQAQDEYLAPPLIIIFIIIRQRVTI